MIDSGPNAEFITVKLDFGSKQIRVILGCGPQVLYSGRNTVKRSMLSIILVGDFNGKLEKDLIPRDDHSISSNSRRFLDVLESFNLRVLNARDFHSEVFARVNNNNPNTKSVFDYICVTEDLIHLVTSIFMDEQKLYTS